MQGITEPLDQDFIRSTLQKRNNPKHFKLATEVKREVAYMIAGDRGL
jgi:hypothetical protein